MAVIALLPEGKGAGVVPRVARRGVRVCYQARNNQRKTVHSPPRPTAELEWCGSLAGLGFGPLTPQGFPAEELYHKWFLAPTATSKRIMVGERYGFLGAGVV